MDGELNTTTPATIETPAAAPGTQQTTEVTTPTTEQQTTFQKWLGNLLGGKSQEATPATAAGEAAPAASTTQVPSGTTYTEADLQAKLEAAKSAWATEQEEQARLAKLSPEERAKAEADTDRKKVADLEAKLLRRDLKDTALAALQKDGFPVGLADLLNYTDQASMEASLKSTQDVFKAALESAVKERLRGKTPEGLGGAANNENALRDQIAKNIRGGLI